MQKPVNDTQGNQKTGTNHLKRGNPFGDALDFEGRVEKRAGYAGYDLTEATQAQYSIPQVNSVDDMNEKEAIAKLAKELQMEVEQISRQNDNSNHVASNASNVYGNAIAFGCVAPTTQYYNYKHPEDCLPELY